MGDYDPSVNLIPAKKGEVRNPNGRPKGSKNRATIFREFLESPDDDGLTREQKMIKSVYQMCIEKGDVTALKEFMDSAYGKNTDALKLSGDENNPINTSLTVRFVDGNDNPEGL